MIQVKLAIEKKTAIYTNGDLTIHPMNKPTK
jgi:hypothetical protein